MEEIYQSANIIEDFLRINIVYADNSWYTCTMDCNTRKLHLRTFTAHSHMLYRKSCISTCQQYLQSETLFVLLALIAFVLHPPFYTLGDFHFLPFKDDMASTSSNNIQRTISAQTCNSWFALMFKNIYQDIVPYTHETLNGIQSHLLIFPRDHPVGYGTCVSLCCLFFFIITYYSLFSCDLLYSESTQLALLSCKIQFHV